MKIGMKEINEGIYYVAINKLKKSLEKEGFSVSLGEKNMYDLFAEKGDDKRIYEIKIGKYKVQERVLSRLQDIAREKKAKLFVTYLEQPRSSQIEYYGIENTLFEYLQNNMPEELDCLSTHTLPQEVSDVEITSILVDDELIRIEGNATLEVELVYGSEMDRKNEMGDEMEDFFDFYFKVSIEKGVIVKAYFKFDLEHFYE